MTGEIVWHGESNPGVSGKFRDAFLEKVTLDIEWMNGG